MYNPSSTLRITQISFLLLLQYAVVQGETAVLDLCIQDYVAGRSENNYHTLLFSYLTPLYKTQTPISYQLFSDLDMVNKQKKDLISILESELSLSTISGKTMLFLEMLHPTTDITTLEQKQQIIRFFEDHAQVIPCFEKIINNMHDGETACLQFLSKQNLSLREKQACFVKIRVLLDTLYKLFQLLEKLDKEALIPLYTALKTLFFQDVSFSELRYMLHHATFFSEKYYFYNPFAVYAAEKKYNNISHESFKSLFHCIGTLEMTIAIARLLIQKHTDYCLAQFVQENKPVFYIENNWHPLLLTHKNKLDIIKNNFSFPTGIKSIIVTGPNTSGKTVITCGFLVAALLAQTLTMVPATECMLTPFDRMYTLLTARSEISRGNSRFMSEMQNVKDLLLYLEEAQNKNQYTLVLLDEIFTGTNPQCGIQAAKDFLEKYAKNKFDQNTLLFLSTHYVALTKISLQLSSYSNYKINIMRKKDGSFQHTFTLEPGISDFSLVTTLL